MDWTLVFVAIISFLGTATSNYFSNRKNTALVTYRLEQLEKKVDLHNSVIERTYNLEKRADITDEKMKVANHRIEDLEGGK
jgi:type VI protein secretion system component VasK